MSDKITVMTIDDHPLWGIGIANAIDAQQDMQLAAQASTGHQAIEYFRKHQPDVIITELKLPDINGIELMIAIHDEFPDARFIILTSFAREQRDSASPRGRGACLHAQEHAFQRIDRCYSPGPCGEEENSGSDRGPTGGILHRRAAYGSRSTGSRSLRGRKSQP